MSFGRPRPPATAAVARAATIAIKMAPRPPAPKLKPEAEGPAAARPKADQARQKTPLSSRDATQPASRIVDQYELTETLHVSQITGTEVHVARHRKTGELVVLKAIDPQRVYPLVKNGRAPLAATMALHAQLEHANVARLHEVFDSQRLVVVMEHVPGITLDLFMLNHGDSLGPTMPFHTPTMPFHTPTMPFHTPTPQAAPSMRPSRFSSSCAVRLLSCTLLGCAIATSACKM